MTRHAIKLFDPRLYRAVEQYWTDMGRIAAQITRLQTVNSPHLVAQDIYEETSGIGYVQMEAIVGASLRRLLDGDHLAVVRARSTPAEWARFTDVIFRVHDHRVRIQPGVALYILRQILRGLETLHDLGYVHADLKPSNLMIDRLGYVKLIDYGRALAINEAPSILLGTPLYMAPEIHRREPTRVQSDIYSVGLIGLEMLRGEPLAPPDTPEPELLRIKEDLPRRLHNLLPDYVRRNATFLLLLQRFLDPQPARRYASAGEAEVGSLGLHLVHKQLAQAGQDTEYGRELEAYLDRLSAPSPRRTG